MASNTSRLDLMKKNPVTDGADTFNIETMLNENWDKIDKRAALIDPATGKLLPGQENPVDTSNLPTKTELNKKVDKEAGKGLSTNDYTTPEKNKLTGIQAGAQVNEVSSNDLEREVLARQTHMNDYVKHPADGGTTGGTASSFTCSSTPNVTSLVDKTGIMITAHVDSGVSPTLRWGPLTAYPLLKPNGNPAILKKDGIYTFRFNAVKSAFMLQGESEVEIGKQIITPGTTNKAILKGLHDGTGYVEGSPNLVAANIKEGVNVFGVVGSALTIPNSYRKQGDGELYALFSTGNGGAVGTDGRALNYHELRTTSSKTEILLSGTAKLSGQISVHMYAYFDGSTMGAIGRMRIKRNGTTISYIELRDQGWYNTYLFNGASYPLRGNYSDWHTDLFNVDKGDTIEVEHYISNNWDNGGTSRIYTSLTCGNGIKSIIGL